MSGRPSKISDEQLLAAASRAVNLRALLQQLGLAACGGNYEIVRGRLERLGALEERFRPPRRAPVGEADPRDCSDEELASVLAGARSRADVLRALGLPATATEYRWLARRLAASTLDASALPGQAWSRGRRCPPRRASAAFFTRGRLVSGKDLRRRLVGEGLVEVECACCGLREWCGRPAPLEVDHVNGDRTDNRVQNLRLLCPNCHAQTPTYRGRNIGRGAGSGTMVRSAAAAASPGGGKQTQKA